MSPRQDAIDAAERLAAEQRRRRVAGESLEVRVDRAEAAQKAAALRSRVDGRYSSAPPERPTACIGCTRDGQPFPCGKPATHGELCSGCHEDAFYAGAKSRGESCE
jgi:hypothetical protein